MKYQPIQNVGAGEPRIVNLRCPACNHAGAFGGLKSCNDVSWTTKTQDGNEHFYAGMRQCPNLECRALIFIILRQGQLDRSFPPEVIDFDSSNLPQPILATLEEAISCHSADCFKATALMVRRLLEELCEDKGAVGASLKDRLQSLGSNIIVPKELLDAADELRLLGNDAAHIEAKSYNSIGKEEAALAIELAKELLKAVYQYSSLVGRLKALKKP